MICHRGEHAYDRRQRHRVRRVPVEPPGSREEQEQGGRDQEPVPSRDERGEHDDGHGSDRGPAREPSIDGAPVPDAPHDEGAERIAARAAELAPEGGRAYFVGHWGWQEHATRSGLSPYVAGHTNLRPGDVVVVPDGVPGQPITDQHRVRLEPIELDVVPSGPLDLVRTVVDREGLYVSWLGLPWTVRDEPLERFRVLRVRPPL